MRLENLACLQCGYVTVNRKSFSNHTRFGCNAGRDYSKEYYVRNRAAVIERSRKRYELKREIINKQRRERYANEPSKEIAAIANYIKTEKGRAVRLAVWHKYRSRKSEGSVSTMEIIDLRKRQPSCVKCGIVHNLEIDHIIPLSKGGKHEVSNLQILCRTCNRRKAAKCN